MPGVLEGEGVNGVENGWAADVDVAAADDSGSGRAVVVAMVRREA